MRMTLLIYQANPYFVLRTSDLQTSSKTLCAPSHHHDHVASFRNSDVHLIARTTVYRICLSALAFVTSQPNKVQRSDDFPCFSSSHPNSTWEEAVAACMGTCCRSTVPPTRHVCSLMCCSAFHCYHIMSRNHLVEDPSALLQFAMIDAGEIAGERSNSNLQREP